jgi:hypothetical protein
LQSYLKSNHTNYLRINILLKLNGNIVKNLS